MIRRHYLPAALIIPLLPAHRERLGLLLPWTAAMAGDEPAVYLCRDFACERPVTSAAELEDLLD